MQASPSQYLQAFCEGLEQALKPYRREITNLERNLLINPDITLMYIFSCVDKYSNLFVLLKFLVEQVNTHYYYLMSND